MEYERIRQRHVARLAGILPEHVARVRWPGERLAAEREQRLRDFLGAALAGSAWHRERLRGIEPSRFREDDLRHVPPMTKTDLMAHWDEIVTDHRLTLDRARRHVATLTSDAYLCDDLHVVASGGSSGCAGVFAFGWEPWVLAFVGLTRMMVWDRSNAQELAGLPGTMAMVAAENATHMTAAMTQTFASPQVQTVRFPVTRPMDEMVAGLNEFQPVTLAGYSSALALLAQETRAGRLRIAPKRIVSTAEPLLAHVREAVERAFAAPVANTWGTSEAGPMASGCWRDTGMHLCDDLVVIELVDHDGAPVPAGTRSDKIFLTAIANPTLPLIRYEITDQMTLLADPCACGSAHRRIADVEGRLDDVFSYPGGAVVHPHVFRSALLRETGVIDYQVRQTERGADILAVGSLADRSATARLIEGKLADLGLSDPLVAVTMVGGLERQEVGKLRRFVPLTR